LNSQQLYYVFEIGYLPNGTYGDSCQAAGTMSIGCELYITAAQNVCKSYQSVMK